jgi:hypothetical protein
MRISEFLKAKNQKMEDLMKRMDSRSLSEILAADYLTGNKRSSHHNTSQSVGSLQYSAQRIEKKYRTGLLCIFTVFLDCYPTQRKQAPLSHSHGTFTTSTPPPLASKRSRTGLHCILFLDCCLHRGNRLLCQTVTQSQKLHHLNAPPRFHQLIQTQRRIMIIWDSFCDD